MRPAAKPTGRKLTEMRRSSASGIHGKYKKDRRNSRRKAIEQSRKDSE